jgi:uncharacterized protein YqhQ
MSPAIQQKKPLPKTEIDMIGGQAVIEGILMRGKSSYVIAIRTKKGIKLKKHKLLGLPIIRGAISFIDAMVLGMQALTWSSNQALGTDEQLSKKEMALVIVAALGLSLLLFFALPFFLTRFLSQTDKGFVFNLLEGLIRITILILYIWAISQMKEVKVLFQYHGAEHKTVNCYESGSPLIVENVRKHSKHHPRCGTSFLIIIMLISVLVFSLIPDTTWYIKLLSRLLLIPLIMGLSYELLKFSAKHTHNILVRILIAPGLMVQRITTSEPDDRQIEVGIASLKGLLKNANNGD